jgi:hypothetical protein
MARSERRRRVVIYQTYDGQEEPVAYVEGIEGHLPQVSIRTNAIDDRGPVFQVLTTVTADTWFQIAQEVASVSTPGGIARGV